MTSIEFAQKLKDVATNYKTLYVMGCFGAPMNAKNKERYKNNHTYNKQPARQAMIDNATADTFGFDCVCLLKGILWGWNGDKTKTYGGATYKSNDVPDIGADSIINQCTEISTNFDEIQIGELLWTKGHVGVYIGDGLCVECTPAWENKVQITAVNRNIEGYKRRNWTKHGKLKYIEYIKKECINMCKYWDGTKCTKEFNEVVEDTTIDVGDTVQIIGNTYYNGKTIPSWVKAKQWIVYSAPKGNNRIVINASTDGKNQIMSPIHIKDLKLIKNK